MGKVVFDVVLHLDGAGSRSHLSVRLLDASCTVFQKQKSGACPALLPIPLNCTVSPVVGHAGVSQFSIVNGGETNFMLHKKQLHPELRKLVSCVQLPDGRRVCIRKVFLNPGAATRACVLCAFTQSYADHKAQIEFTGGIGGSSAARCPLLPVLFNSLDRVPHQGGSVTLDMPTLHGMQRAYNRGAQLLSLSRALSHLSLARLLSPCLRAHSLAHHLPTLC